MATLSHIKTFTVVTCDTSGCGVSFALDDEFIAARRRDRKLWYCPNGHSRWYPGETDRDKIQRLTGELDQERTRLDRTAKQLDYARRAQKATSTRLKKVKHRVHNGVCPCCNRTFQNLQRHMQSKHPTYGGADGSDA